MTAHHPEKSIAITGIGQSAVTREPGVGALRLTLEACRAAIADAGLSIDEIDGIASYPGTPDNGTGFSPVGLHDVRMAMNLRPQWYASTSMESAAQMSALFASINALAAGMARHVLVFRTTAEATARRNAAGAMAWGAGARRVEGMWQWTVPFGGHSPAPWYGLFAQRYFYEHGLTSEGLGAIALNGRKMAAGNPAAIYREPITLDDYMGSRMIASPLRLYDCDVPVDGSVAFVLSRVDAAGDLRNPPLRFEAIGCSFDGGGVRAPTDLTSFGAESPARMMWSRTDLRLADIDVAQIYDGFSILTVHWLEALGFFAKGEAGDYLSEPGRFGLQANLPMNTGGGQLSAGRLHGFGHIHEACVQLWGRGGARQVADQPRVALVCNGAYGLGCLLLQRD
ncbi:MAG: thiolase family protein [Pseudomonadota bacterium]